MDIQVTTKKKPYYRYLTIAATGLALVAGIYFFKSYFGSASAIVDLNKLTVSEVQSGDFTVTVRGNGVLKPKKAYWLSARVDGRIEIIHVKSGAKVTKGQPIVQLINPQLKQELDRSIALLNQEIAEQEATLATLDSQYLDLQVQALRTEMAYKSSKLEYDAQTKLMKSGSYAISEIDYKRSQFEVERNKKELELQLRGLGNFKQNIAAQKNAQKEKIENLRISVTQNEDQVANLTVRATADGVLQNPNQELGQNINLELGQNVLAGDSLGTISDTNDLIAQIDIQELQIKDVQLGQSVMIDTRKSKIKGKVHRIEPLVNKGLVAVEVELEESLQPEGRPELSIEGIITITHIKNALYVKKPMYAKEYESANVYLLSKGSNLASATRVRFGQSSVSDIEVMSGLKSGDRIIVSATDSFSDSQQIFINN